MNNKENIMKADFQNTIKQTNEPRDVLLPLYELITNGLDSIREKYDLNKDFNKGFITVELTRENVLFEENKGRIIDIVVKDNGLGFTYENRTSIDTLNSSKKEKFGCKGFGRIVCLRVCDYLDYFSIFKENNEFKSIKFKYDKNFDFENLKPQNETNKSNEYTEVTLKNIVYTNSNKNKELEKGIDFIYDSIIKHFLPYFLSIPDNLELNIEIKDGGEKREVSKNSFKPMDSDTFFIKKGDEEYKFKISHYKLKKKYDHSISLSADNRKVKDIKLNNFMPNSMLMDKDGERFSYLGVISSTYLDDKSSINREFFNIDESSDSDVSMNDITNEAEVTIKNYLSFELEEDLKEKKEKVKECISGSDIKYKYMLKNENVISKVANMISKGSSIEKVQESLDYIHTQTRRYSCNKIDKLLSENNNLTNIQKEEILEEVHNYNDIKESDLAEHIIHRRGILTLLDRVLEVQANDDKYHIEKDIHDIIYPVKEESVNSRKDYNKHNLWLLDDSLSYYDYLCSDISMKANKRFLSESKNRPDIAMDFINSLDSQNANQIVIVELKRPGDKGSKSRGTIIDQIMDYVDEISSGDIKVDIDAPINKGRFIGSGKKFKYHGYAICNIDEKLRSYITGRHSGKLKPGSSNSYVIYKTEMELVIEVIDFGELLSIAKKRNKILFDKLGLES